MNLCAIECVPASQAMDFARWIIYTLQKGGFVVVNEAGWRGSREFNSEFCTIYIEDGDGEKADNALSVTYRNKAVIQGHEWTDMKFNWSDIKDIYFREIWK